MPSLPFTRRSFLKTSALAAPALLGLNAVVRAQTAREGKLGVALCGLGGFSRQSIAPELPSAKNVYFAGAITGDAAKGREWAKQYGFPEKNVWSYADMARLAEAKDIAIVHVVTPNSLHAAHTIAAATAGKHVMVEKPMAVSLEQAEKMAALARTHGIHLLTNFATSWFASNREAYRLVHDEKQIGAVRKVVVHDGHWGPAAIGCGPEFLGWLTDPVRNGGGAIMDFGCYGANLMHWLLDGEQPVAVTAVTRTFQPEYYPRVDDDATIIVDYPSAQCVIHGSWNWPWHRKDMEIYGTNGAVVAVDPDTLRSRVGLNKPEQTTRSSRNSLCTTD